MRSSVFAACAAGTLLILATAAQAQVVLAPPTPQTGSSNPVTADPPVARPHVQPCVVPLLTNQAFADFNNKDFSYTPPAGCPGPWSKVVLTADFTVTAGRQFDRTAEVFLGGANIFFGTTAEPRASLSPSWHVERDITDLSALLTASQPGTAILGNFVGVDSGITYDGIIYGDVQLEFYPAGKGAAAAQTPDVVIGLPGNSGAATLANTAATLSQTLTLPSNIESAYLDVISQSQSADEFWYLCVPDDLAGPLESCGGSGYRETEVTIDGQPAGVAPVYPWIYTGGVDPYLWEPIPGVQTLNFKPYRVDLTPFAGVLSDGQPHTVALSVFNADNYFAVTANLLLNLDHQATKVTGAVTADTLTAPQPVVTSQVNVDSAGNASGPVTVSSNRSYTISGYVNTSHGRVETTIHQDLGFSNTQTFTINATTYSQVLKQSTTVKSQTTTAQGGHKTVTETNLSYPFSFNLGEVVNNDGSFSQTSISDQKLLEDTRKKTNGEDAVTSHTANHVASNDTLNISAAGALIGAAGSGSTQQYVQYDSQGLCYNRTLTSSGNVLTAVSKGPPCQNQGGNQQGDNQQGDNQQ